MMSTNPIDNPIVCPAEDSEQVMTLHPSLGTMFGLKNFNEMYLWKTNNRSPYRFNYGNTEYEVSKFHFYDPSGQLYSTKQGYFEYHEDVIIAGNPITGTSRHSGVSFKTKQKLLKRMKIDRTFNWGTAHYADLLFFVSRGKMGYYNIQAEVYIPFSYLRNMGFKTQEVSVDINPREFWLRLELVAPHFFITLSQERRYRESELTT